MKSQQAHHHYHLAVRSKRRRRRLLRLLALSLLLVCAASASALFLFASPNGSDPEEPPPSDRDGGIEEEEEGREARALVDESEEREVSSTLEGGAGDDEEGVMLTGSAAPASPTPASPPCATVEEMGEVFRDGSVEESLRVRELIRRHLEKHGAPTVRGLPSDQFCKKGFVLAKASEAGFGNEMYKILTGAALSVMLNRSLIIGQTRNRFPFEEFISYTNLSFTLTEVKHLWRKNKCIKKYGRELVIRTDDFSNPAETNVLCSDWGLWKQPIIWFQETTDAVGSQFFLKNIHQGMQSAASNLFGKPESLRLRANVFGELMRVIISPSGTINRIIDLTLNGSDPDVTLHMRMMTNRSVRAMNAALNCLKKALHHYQLHIARPRVVLVSDTPSFISGIMANLTHIAEVIHFDYKSYIGSVPNDQTTGQHKLDFRGRDWGPAPRWVAFVDFFLASRAKHAVISGAHRRVGTTYAQLISALAAAEHLGDNSSTVSSSSFFSSFQSNLLVGGLANQVGWGHAWNRYAGPLSCHNQGHQCAHTPLVPPAWWDGEWQSPISRDIRRLQAYGVQLTDTGKVRENSLNSFCNSRKERVKIIPLIQQCKNLKCI